MRAAVSTSEEPWLHVTDVADPVPGPSDLVLQVEACGICGSDLHMAHALREHPGMVFGHELCGTVVAVGSQVRDRREGDRIVGFPLVGCGQCGPCLASRTEKCARVELVGARRPGAYAEYVAVRSADSFGLPEGLSADVGALVEPLAVAHHALDLTPRRPADPVLVLGAGPVGLAVALWARALGTPAVALSDPNPARRALAQHLGFDVIDPDAGDVGTAFADLTGARPAGIVECIGRPAAVQHAIDIAAVDGHITFVGACMEPATFHPLGPTAKELSMRFVIYYSRSDFSATIDALSSGSLDASGLITGHVDLDGLPAQFTELMGSSAHAKVLIHP